MLSKLHQKKFIDCFRFQNTRIIMIFVSIMLLFLLSIPFLLQAQTPEWVYQYVNPDFYEIPYAITVDSAGNTYTTGYVGIGNNGGVGVIKLDSQGNEKWIYWNDLGTSIIGHSIDIHSDRLHVGGYIDSLGTRRLIVACIDTSGNEQWLFKDTLDTGEGYGIGLSSLHDIYIAGYKYPTPSDWLVIKLDSLGNEKWRYVYDGPGNSYDQARSLAIDKAENIYIGGYSTGIGTGEDFTVIKLDSAGNEKWVYRYDGPAHAYDVCGTFIDTTGYVYAAGTSNGIGLDYCVIKLDSLGNEKWIYRYNGTANGDDYFSRRAVDDSSNVYVSGNTWRSDGRYLFTVIGIDSLGNERWCYLNSGPADMGGSGGPIALDGLGSVYVSGHFRNTADRMQIAVIKFSSAGDTNWVYIHPHVPPSPFNDSPRDAMADANGNVYITGKICVSSFDDDIVVLKFPSQNQIKTMKHQKTISNDIMSTICRGEITITSNNAGLLTIHDVTGRTILQQAISPARNLHIRLQPGVYFLQIEGGQYPVTKKKIIVL